MPLPSTKHTNRNVSVGLLDLTGRHVRQHVRMMACNDPPGHSIQRYNAEITRRSRRNHWSKLPKKCHSTRREIVLRLWCRKDNTSAVLE